MVRRKKTTAGAGAKKGKRVNLSVRVAALGKTAPAAESENDLITDGPETPSTPEEVKIRQANFIKYDGQKQMMMWVGVTFFMALVLFVWVLNLKSVFKEQQISSKTNEQLDLNEISSQFNKTIEEVGASLNKFNNLASSTVSTSSSPANFMSGTAAASSSAVKTASSSASASESSQITELRQKLEELEKRLSETSPTKSGVKTKK